mgnify:CR=1 FL=1
MKKRKRILSLLLVCVLCFSMTGQAQASKISAAKKKAQVLQSKKKEAVAEKKKLLEQLESVLDEMETTKKKITAKEDEISKKEDELLIAQVDEDNQYEDMKKRIKYMYENGNAKFIEILCQSKSLSDFLNNAEYISTISSYDRTMLKKFQKVVKNVQAQEEVLKKENAELEKMQDCGKQMGVLALNAAIEAGRMGEGGKQFVTAAETIRVSAGTYDELIDQAHKRLADSDERIAELEEQVHRMVTLLKENNVAMTKLMKSCQEAARQAQEWNRLKPCPNFKEMENQIVVLRNADEEIAKSEERNRMQMEDFTEEMESQKKNFDELLQSMETVYRHAAERKK